jgi:hypothetical protein
MRNILSLAVLSLSAFVLSGCAADFNTVTPTPANIAIQGRMYGGQQPVTGAKVYLYAAGTGRIRHRVDFSADHQRRIRHH